jgi:hypothetical protein
MTEHLDPAQQDCRDGLEISAPVGYARAVEEPGAGGPARASFLDGQPAEPAAAAATGQDPPAWLPTPTPEQREFPLRDRGADLQRRFRRRLGDAVTPREQLAVLNDYLRAALGSADRVGMRHAASAHAVRAAITAMGEAADTLTDAMQTWSPHR